MRTLLACDRLGNKTGCNRFSCDQHIWLPFFTSASTVHFRAVVFRPLMEEILMGTVKSCTSEGVFGKTMIQLHPLIRTTASIHNVLDCLFSTENMLFLQWHWISSMTFWFRRINSSILHNCKEKAISKWDRAKLSMKFDESVYPSIVERKKQVEKWFLIKTQHNLQYISWFQTRGPLGLCENWTVSKRVAME